MYLGAKSFTLSTPNHQARLSLCITEYPAKLFRSFQTIHAQHLWLSEFRQPSEVFGVSAQWEICAHRGSDGLAGAVKHLTKANAVPIVCSGDLVSQSITFSIRLNL